MSQIFDLYLVFLSYMKKWATSGHFLKLGFLDCIKQKLGHKVRQHPSGAVLRDSRCFFYNIRYDIGNIYIST